MMEDRLGMVMILGGDDVGNMLVKQRSWMSRVSLLTNKSLGLS